MSFCINLEGPNDMLVTTHSGGDSRALESRGSDDNGWHNQLSLCGGVHGRASHNSRPRTCNVLCSTQGLAINYLRI
ncbi:hypothetical protein J6590_025187 [Homalodisca vitripennis]|nr:hypothetical protein J6590_025187 [Homalodisca vitripennis]